jgi:hypothetical protein
VTNLLISFLMMVISLPFLQEVPERTESEVDRLLDRLEIEHGAIRLFSSPLTYRKDYDLEGDFETRLGEIAVTIDPPDRDVVLVFDQIIDASGHGTSRSEYHAFEEGWWIEMTPDRKRIVRRQISRPGEDRDPFKLGEGPFPLPLAQKADSVRRRFVASIGTVPDEPLFRGLKDVEVLHLIPRTGTTAHEDHESIDLIFEKTSLLPVGVLVRHRNGDRTSVWLRSPELHSDEVGFMNGRIQKELSALRRKATAESWLIEVKVLPKATAEPETEGSRP